MQARLVASLTAFAAPLLAAGQYLGSASCAPCHSQQHERQSMSRHASALRPILETEMPQRLQERPLRERGGVHHEYEVVDGGLMATAIRHQSEISRAVEDQATLLLEWTFGAGSQGLTAMGRRGGRFVEHRVSYYPRRRQPAITLGHPMPPPQAARRLVGVEQPAETAFQCFNCHATSVGEGRTAPDLSSMEPGVRCERCHGPGAEHVDAAAAGEIERAQRAIRSVPDGPFDSVVFCGQCHRNPEPRPIDEAPEKRDPLSVRFQPIGLLASRCFQQSGSLSCVSCHDPHDDAGLDANFYRGVCLSCHQGDGDSAPACPRQARGECLGCHMRQTEPTPNLTFTDHRIRVYEEVQAAP